MELPKNITQIGEVGRDCRIYVEDYVVSYMKQLNQLAQDKGMAIALYGRRCEEEGVVYYFLYGACKVTYLQREVRHLSQAQRQEIENLRKKYFPEYVFLGYRLLNGEMVEGFHICEQEICRYISGYAQFYEKNDAMLAYMLAVRDEAKPEQVDRGKYEEVKHRQEERRAAAIRSARLWKKPEKIRKKEKRSVPGAGNLRSMSAMAAGVFALLCLVGVIGLQDRARREGIEDIQASTKQWFEKIVSPRLTDPQEEAVPASADVKKDVLTLEDKLEQALLEENNRAKEERQAGEAAPGQAETPAEKPTPEPSAEPETENGSEQETEPAQEAEAEQELSAVETGQAPETVAYIVRRGDTLTRISIRQYGSDKRVADICALNSISNPDDIKEGQVLMLPQ